MKSLLLLMVFWAGICFGDEIKDFSASRSVKYSLPDIKSALQIYFQEARTNHPAIYFAPIAESTNSLSQFWMDCAGGPPGALSGSIIAAIEPAGTVRLEVKTSATRPQNENATEQRRVRTEKTLDEIIAVLERKKR